MQKYVSWPTILSNKYKLQDLSCKSELLSSNSVNSHLRPWLPFQNLLCLRPLGTFPVGRRSNAASVVGLLYMRGLGWNALRHWGQILLAT